MNKEKLIEIIKSLPDGEIEYFHYAPKMQSQKIKADMNKNEHNLRFAICKLPKIQ